MNERFSRKTVHAELRRRAHNIERRYRFDRRNGTAQLRGKSEETHRAYAEWNLLLNLAEDFDMYIERPSDSEGGAAT